MRLWGKRSVSSIKMDCTLYIKDIIRDVYSCPISGHNVHVVIDVNLCYRHDITDQRTLFGVIPKCLKCS